MWLGRDPAIIRDPACIAYLIYTAPASKQDPALIWTRLINGHIRYVIPFFPHIFLFILSPSPFTSSVPLVIYVISAHLSLS